MRIYKISFNLRGKEDIIYIKAISKKEAIKILKKRYKKALIKGIVVIEKRDLLKEIKKKFSFKSFKLEEIIFIFEQLYVMLDAGISIDNALLNIIDGMNNKRLKIIFEDIYNKVNSGASLYNAFKKYENDLGIIVTAMVSLGEESGDIAHAFKELSIILNEINDNRKRFKKATRYPFLIIFVMFIAFIIIVIFVIPPFKAIFKQLNAELPLATKLLLWVEGAVVNYGWGIFIISFTIFTSLNYLYKHIKKVRLFFDKLFLKVYILGKVVKLAMLGRFIFVFKSLVENGIPIVSAFDVSISIVDNLYLKDRLYLIKDEIVKGGLIASGFKKSAIFEPMIVQMIKAGEESGNLVKMFDKISSYYLKEYRYLVDNIAVLIEPILIAAIAGFIFTIALGVFLPMWNLTEVM